MAGKSNSKLKTLVLADILREQTDENHPMSAAELCRELEQYGIEAERKSIYSNLDVLTDYGLDIIKTGYPKKGCYLGARDFEAAEIRLLVDAVQSAGFITSRKTKSLTAKIEKSLSRYQREELAQQVYMDNPAKSTNERIYYTIDALSRAIRAGKKVRLHYSRRKIEAGDSARQEERIFTLSPYALIWFDDHYYLVCNNQKYDNFMHIRAERIREVKILDEEDIRDCAEFSEYKNGFDCVDYTLKIFNGYAGEPERVKLECDNELIQAVSDRFGDKVRIDSTSDTKFCISVSATVSEGFVDWILQFGNKMMVQKPETLRQLVYNKAKETAALYEGSGDVDTE